MQGNVHLVCTQGERMRIMRPPSGLLTADEAMELAAWLVSLAEIHASRNFEDVLKEVQNT